jgi:hypothetical protein
MLSHVPDGVQMIATPENDHGEVLTHALMFVAVCKGQTGGTARNH